MKALFVLIALSMIVAIGFLVAFIWNVKNGQYDDDYTPSVRILFDDEIVNNKTNSNKNNTKTQSLTNKN